MEKRIKNYLAYMKKMTERESALSEEDAADLRKDLLTQIYFFQHERLAHLIVTAVFAVLTMLVFLGCVLTSQRELYIIVALLLVLLVPYIRHYYILENGVQKLYEYYDVLKGIYGQ